MKPNTKLVIFISIVFISFSVIFLGYFFDYNVSSVFNLIHAYPSISLIIYVGLIALSTATTLPITVTLAVGILVFKFTSAVLFAFLGIYFGAVIIYYLSLKTGKNIFSKFSNLGSGKLKIMNNLLHENTLSFVMLLNFVYFFPSNLAHISAGVTHLNFWKFSFATIFGNFPNTFSIALLILGIYQQNYIYMGIAMILLVLVTGVSLYIYRKHLKDIIIIAFSKEAWKKFEKIEEILK